jgi:hypothetical protein
MEEKRREDMDPYFLLSASVHVSFRIRGAITKTCKAPQMSDAHNARGIHART